MTPAETSVYVHADPADLAEAAADRLIVHLRSAQDARGSASLVLTGGRIASLLYGAVRTSPARASVDWSRVDLWWGDERFLPPGSPDRNETQARAALLSELPLTPGRVHPIPFGNDAAVAAAAYAEALAAAGAPAPLPHFDVVLLGVGEDGHVASIFPEHPVVHETRPVCAVHNSPKPPPTRVTLTLPVLNTADEVWLIAAGADKAHAVGAALTGGAGPLQLPAAGVHGVQRTLWWLDRAAADEVPPALRSLR